jgi:RNA-directed DNA polymerase
VCGEPAASETGTVRFGGGRLETQVRLCAGRLPYIVILIDAYPQHDWLLGAVEKRLRQELALLQVPLNEAKSRVVDLANGDSFGFLGFDFRRVRTHSGKWRAHYAPQMKKRTVLLRRLKAIFRRYQSQPIDRVI